MPASPVTRVEVSRSALASNTRQFRRLAGRGRRLLAVVKANAYGHGLVEASRVFLESGADWLGVHSLDEGLALRRAGITAPVLVLGYVPIDGLEDAVAGDLRVMAYNAEILRPLAAAARKIGRPARLHVKVETGTHRQGVAADKAAAFIRRIRSHPGLEAEGLASHFANIEDTTSRDYPDRQMEAFRQAEARLADAGIDVPVKHMSCTAAALLFPETRHALVRVGIGLYGLWPSKETFAAWRAAGRRPLELRPALSWKAVVAQVKDVPKGAFVGYGCTYRTTRRSRLAIVPVGYYEGYPRSLSNGAHVLIHGRRAPVRGRIAMDFLTADITDIPAARLEDEAVLIGASGAERVTANDLAALAGTIGYEIVSRINPLLPRVMVR